MDRPPPPSGQAVEGLIDAPPCFLGRAQLPQIVDADPEWRAKAQYTRDELVALISDRRIPQHERVANALLGLAGLRVGEMSGLRFRSLALEMPPLGRIVVARSYNKGGAKTRVVRWMPVHPVLGRILHDWAERRFAEAMGRPPVPDDLVLPTPPLPKGKGRRSRPWQMRPRPPPHVHLARSRGRRGQGPPASRDAPAAEGRDGTLHHRRVAKALRRGSQAPHLPAESPRTTRASRD